MLILSILILISCKALSFINQFLSFNFYMRISTLILLFSSILIYNTLTQIGLDESGVGIYGGLFHVTSISQFIEFFLLVIASLILISWPVKQENINIEPSHTQLKTQTEPQIQPQTEPQTQTQKYSSDRLFFKNSINYSIIILFSSLGASLLISSWDLISMYISIELQSFSLYVLSTLFKDSEKSTSAGLKYFLLGGLASCIILLGSGFIYSNLGLTNFESIFSIVSVLSLEESRGFQLGIIIIFIGFLIKIAAAPLHNWSPDVYDDTPTIVTIWLTLIPKISILIFLLELFIQLNIEYTGIAYNLIWGVLWRETGLGYLLCSFGYFKWDILMEKVIFIDLLKYLLLFISLTSLIIGGLLGLSQKRIKRLLAYSTINHLGFILLALTIFSSQSLESFIFYIIQYTLTNLNIFLIIIALSYLNQNYLNEIKLNNNNNNKKLLIKGIKDLNYISDFKGLFWNNPIISLCFSICLFSLAGIPPLIGFFSKQFVLLSALQEGYYFISLVAIIVSVISASYYLKIIKEIFFEGIGIDKEKVFDIKKIKPLSKFKTENYVLSNSHSYIISVLTLIILFFIFKPSLILNPIYWLITSFF